MVKRGNGARIYRHAGQLQNVVNLCFFHSGFLLCLSVNSMASIALSNFQQVEVKPL